MALSMWALLLTAQSAVAQTVIDDDRAGVYTSMVLDATTGFPIIAYGAYADDGYLSSTLRLAFCNDLLCTNPTITVVDDAANVGGYNSMQLNASGYPVIAYQDNDNDRLKLAVCNDATCSSPTITVIDDASEPGQYNVLALGANDYPIIATHDSDTRDLELVYCSDVACASSPAFVTVDSTGWSGSYAEMVLNSSGFPVISYRSQPGGVSDPGEIRLAVCNDATCSSPTLTTVTDESSTTYNAIVLDANGYPIIAYDTAGITGRPLKLAVCNDTTCSNPSFTTIDSASSGFNSMGPHNAMVLDANGYPIISYHDANNRILKLALCDDVSCSNPDLRIIDDSGNAGRFGSLLLDANGNLLISYFDDATESLKLLVLEFDAPEVGVVTPPATVTANTPTVEVSVQYVDDTAIDTATIDTTDISVSGGATVTGVSTAGSGTPITATYTITGSDGNFDIFDNGNYSINVVADEVGDTSGNTVAAALIVPAFEVAITRGSPYDINADGVISPVDVIYVVNRIGETKDTNNATADVNNDDVIDKTDAELVIAAIGVIIP